MKQETAAEQKFGDFNSRARNTQTRIDGAVLCPTAARHVQVQRFGAQGPADSLGRGPSCIQEDEAHTQDESPALRSAYAVGQRSLRLETKMGSSGLFRRKEI